jgi:hypothetical protein
MELSDALAQISEIRAHIAKTEVFRGYRSLTVGFSGVVAIVTAAIQSRLLADPAAQAGAYLTLWIAAAAISVVVVATELFVRAYLARSSVTRQLTIMAAEQFLPSMVAGGVLTAVIARCAIEQVWMLPGLWAVIFALGVFASHRLLPWQTFWVAGYYLACGAALVALGPGWALWPWSMAITFGGGQLFAGAIFYFTLERRDHGQS